MLVLKQEPILIHIIHGSNKTVIKARKVNFTTLWLIFLISLNINTYFKTRMAYILKMNRFIILRDIPKQGPKEVFPSHFLWCACNKNTWSYIMSPAVYTSNLLTDFRCLKRKCEGIYLGQSSDIKRAKPLIPNIKHNSKDPHSKGEKIKFNQIS